MRFAFFIYLVLIWNTTFSQEKEKDIKKWEFELTHYTSDEIKNPESKKHIAWKLLALDGLNRKAVNYLVEMYGRLRQKDSIHKLFRYLIENNPGSPEPYLLITSEGNAYWAGLGYDERIAYLKKGYETNPKHTKTLYRLGELYYKKFLDDYKR